MKNNEQKIAYQVRTTAIIWGLATAMLGICVPLTAIAQSGVILPLAVIIGAGAGTVSVWRNTRRSDLNTITQSQDRLLAIETRIIDLETICSSQEFEREQKYEQLESDGGGVRVVTEP
ncbi:hypothetical protein [Myxosarcina sp. GI1(2024)]